MHASTQAAAPLRIRSAERRDLDAIIEIDAELSGAEKPGYWRERLHFDDQRPGGQIFLVAEIGGRVAGFVIGEVRAWEFGSPACGWVFAIGVARDRRLQAVGTHLLDELSGHFRRAGVTKMRTMVERQDHELLSFFRSHGMMAGPFLQLEMELEAAG